MMNGPGKSDSLTVPGKSSNNAGKPDAEGMEGNGLAKGNLPQQNASRTPSRNDAPSALERVRQAAKKDKKLRFTALLHHAHGDVIVVRFADDIVLGSQKKADADQFRIELTERIGKFNLELHPQKTRLLEFGPFAIDNRKRRGEGKP